MCLQTTRVVSKEFERSDRRRSHSRSIKPLIEVGVLRHSHCQTFFHLMQKVARNPSRSAATTASDFEPHNYLMLAYNMFPFLAQHAPNAFRALRVGPSGINKRSCCEFLAYSYPTPISK
jgi:hypothetical protein